jgi:hypothetical protein
MNPMMGNEQKINMNVEGQNGTNQASAVTVSANVDSGNPT